MRNNNKGFLIIIDGADGTGKATQLENASKFLKKNKIKFKTFDFPRYYDSYWGKMVGRYLNGEFGDGENINPYVRTMFFILDHAGAAKEIKKWLDKGYLVLSNRYTSSNVLQAVGFKERKARNDYMDWLEDSSFNHLGVIKPDLILALYADPKVAFANIEKKASREYTKSKRDMYEQKFHLQRDAAEEFRYQALRKKDWRLVNVTSGKQMRAIDEITKEIIEIIMDFTKIKKNR